MALQITEVGIDHRGSELPDGVCALARKDSAEIVGFKVRWREEDQDGRTRQPSKSFSKRKLGSLDRALKAATDFLAGAREAVRVDGAVARADTAGAMTPNELLQEWITTHGPEVSEAYGEKVVRLWANEIEHRPIAQTRLERISADPSTLVRFQDELVKERMQAPKRRDVLSKFRSVMRWGRRRHPGALTLEMSGLLELPKNKKSRLAYAPDAIGMERIIEAILNRPARDDLLPLRDAAFAASMAYTVASRPSEWRLSVRLENLFPPPPDGGIGTVELQRAGEGHPEIDSGLKTGAHVALLLSNAWDRIAAYREALEDRYGPQPENALLFQVLGPEGPTWISQDDGRPVPLAWSMNNYNHWVKRVWLPAREIAAQAPDAPPGLERMVFYDCRHFAISMALHSTLVVGPHGMNLHPLAGWAAHDIQTLQRYYSHMIARYLGKPPVDIEQECGAARETVEANPYRPDQRAGPQREAQRRRRARAKRSSGREVAGRQAASF